MFVAVRTSFTRIRGNVPAVRGVFAYCRERPFATQQKQTPVCIDFNDLKKKDADLSKEIEQAYGFEGLGLLTVKNVPGVREGRTALLPLGHHLANLPREKLLTYERPATYYSFGWSHGKEILEGKPDWSKGSFYANPQYDRPNTDEALIKAFPSYCSPNVWPEDTLPELRPCFKAIGTLIVEVGLLLAKHCDMYVSSKSKGYEFGRLNRIIGTSLTAKGRLLHYFPLSEEAALKTAQGANVSSWCGWHNDHGSLTGLLSSLYLDKEGNEVPNPDPSSGLYIKTRTGGVIQASYPADHLAFQIGEAAQIHSGGLLQATPHSVVGAVGPKAVGVSRNTLAVFMQPMWNERMDVPTDLSEDGAKHGSSREFLPPGLPPLDVRWTNGIDFGTFTNQTIANYH